jgi:putative PIN family toxin of toxin-antitoxin system
MRFTLDTNVLVSAFIARHGHSANPLELALTVESIKLVLSKRILQEFEDVLMRDEVKDRFSYTSQDVRRRVTALRQSAIIVRVRSRFKVIKEDPKDDIVLNTACDGKSDYIVSGDRDLLRTRRFRGIRIVNPRQMMGIISKEFPDFVMRMR